MSGYLMPIQFTYTIWVYNACTKGYTMVLYTQTLLNPSKYNNLFFHFCPDYSALSQVLTPLQTLRAGLPNLNG